MNIPDRNRLLHMLEATETGLAIVDGISKAQFFSDKTKQLAIVRLIEIIGEAAARTSKETQLNYPEIDWQAMIGMRNILIHAYFSVDMEIVWKTVQNDFPDFYRKLNQILESEG